MSGHQSNSNTNNIFEVGGHHKKIEVDNIDERRSNFFDLPDFGPKKKRSSTDPGKLVLMSDDEEQNSARNSARNPFSDNKTQTISNNDAFSQSHSIIMSDRVNVKSGTYNITDTEPDLQNEESMTLRASIP